MKRILFVCHGNICRSPMAEFVMKKLVHDAGLDSEFEIASAATSTEEIGNDMYPPAKRCLKAHGVDFSSRRARQVTKFDYDLYDYIICMDDWNLRNLKFIIPNDPENKISKLMTWTGEDRDVADPWYTGNFEVTYRDVVAGCGDIMKKTTLY